ncbi:MULTISPECIES: hypothetical protein [Parachlamydia]|jgi:hypothetical protein|uniref:Uncharacterized protein n=2 Tax=Parachlamydia acanthamoebae TaxID=83552 RepID=F8KZ56_PARAV|nr:hypothetical protein [Parachlamydia acanthamoebae]EFB41941.1 hypothetical protein pah_c022o271 [Parachlamydia acanthamoebae str. Hall's coccus]CCB86179.1 putative uncharacterized protein [Parachlamydia acanthamoebae UV-7]
MTSRLIFILLCFFLWGCNTPPPSDPRQTQEIGGREDGNPPTRFPVYQAKVPLSWIRKDALHTQSLQDSTLPICEFFIREEQNEVRVTVHNFPNASLESRVPPLAQISRWKKQFEQLNPLHQHTQPQSWGGFVGLYFEGSGQIKGEQVKMLGWCMQLARDHFLNVQQKLLISPDPYFKQALADYTIKALGPKEFVEQHQTEIEAFANSFELIKELPRQ